MLPLLCLCSLPFPKPPQGIKEQPENLGEYLTGNRIENSGYKLQFLDNENCKYLAKHDYTKDQISQWQLAIKEDYHVNWIMDNIPSAAAIDDYDTKTQTVVYDLGFPVGLLKTKGKAETYWLYNHAKMTISYHCPQGALRCLGFPCVCHIF